MQAIIIFFLHKNGEFFLKYEKLFKTTVIIVRFAFRTAGGKKGGNFGCTKDCAMEKFAIKSIRVFRLNS